MVYWPLFILGKDSFVPCSAAPPAFADLPVSFFFNFHRLPMMRWHFMLMIPLVNGVIADPEELENLTHR